MKYLKVFLLLVGAGILIIYLLNKLIPEPVAYNVEKVWNQDSTQFFQAIQYTLGVFGGGYTEITFKDDLYLKYKLRTVIKGGWLKNGSLLIAANKQPLVENIKETDFKIEITETKRFLEYLTDSSLVSLTK